MVDFALELPTHACPRPSLFVTPAELEFRDLLVSANVRPAAPLRGIAILYAELGQRSMPWSRERRPDVGLRRGASDWMNRADVAFNLRRFASSTIGRDNEVTSDGVSLRHRCVI